MQQIIKHRERVSDYSTVSAINLEPVSNEFMVFGMKSVCSSIIEKPHNADEPIFAHLNYFILNLLIFNF